MNFFTEKNTKTGFGYDLDSKEIYLEGVHFDQTCTFEMDEKAILHPDTRQYMCRTSWLKERFPQHKELIDKFESIAKLRIQQANID